MQAVTGDRVWFRFYGETNDFLTRSRRHCDFEHPVGVTDTAKHVMESLGVPHTEIDRVMINGELRSLSERLTSGDRVEIFPHTLPVLLHDPRFVVDGHLGRLAAYLRMLGFDTWYDRFADDPLLATVSSGQGRFLLTRDVGLLKRREVEQGYCVRSDKPQNQLREVASRFALSSQSMPFRRCMECNGFLGPVSKEDIADELPPHTRETKNEFSRCSSCKKIFWRGSHYTRMSGWIKDLATS